MDGTYRSQKDIERMRLWSLRRDDYDKQAHERAVKLAEAGFKPYLHIDLNQAVRYLRIMEVDKGARLYTIVRGRFKSQVSTKLGGILNALDTVELAMISRRNAPLVHTAIRRTLKRSKRAHIVLMHVDEAKTLANWLNQKQISG